MISGTIDADASQGGTSGVYSVTVTASDSEGGTTTSTFDYTVSNVAPVTDTEIGAQSADDADAVNLDVSGSFSDADNDTLTYSATGLPGGLSMSSAGVISGTIDADASQGGTSGVYSVTVTASDSEGGTTTSTFDYTVSNVAPVTDTEIGAQSADDADAVNLDVSGSFSDADNDTLTYSATGLPGGLSMSSAGVISGTIDADASQGGTSGVYSVTVTASDSEGGTTTSTFDYTVSNVAPVTDTEIGAQSADDADAVNLDVSGSFSDADNDTLTYSATGLPGGLSMSSAGVISGTIDADASQGGTSGVYSVTVTASDSEGGTTTSTFDYTVSNVAPVTDTEIGAQSADDADAVNLDVSGSFSDADNDTLTYSATGLPGGLSMSSAGVISGTIDADASQGGTSGVYSVTVTASDSEGGTTTSTFDYTVSNVAPVTDTEIGAQSADDADAVNLDVSGSFSDADNDTLTYSATGLPGGLSMSSAGVISGTIDADASQGGTSGVYSVTVTASDSEGGTTTSTFDYTVSNVAPVTDTEIGAQSADDADAVNLDVSGSFSDADNDTLTYSATGLPGGLSMSSAGVISGTIDADASQGGTSGVYSVTVTASDSEGGTTTSTFDYTVSNVAPVTDTEIGAQSADDADAVNLDVSGSFSDADNDTLTYSATGLPGGLSMSSAGVISGTIDADASQGGTSGVYSVTVTASDSEGGTTTSTFDYTVSNVAPVTDTEIGAQSADDADAVNLDVSGSFSDADNDTLTYSATGLPGGLSMSSAGVISGTIDADASQGGTSGVYSVTVTASDSEGGTTTSTFDYTVSNVAPVTDTEIGAQSADDADAVNLDVSGSFSDADNDTLTYSATGLPGGLSMSSAGVISGTIDADASQGGTSGVYSVTVTASDSEGGTTTSTFDYTVSNVAPVTDTEIGAQSADDADAVNLDVSGSFSDADNDTLTYSATGLPGGLSMSSAGVISGTIDADASQGGTSGVYSVTVTASDSEGGTTTSTFDYTVSNVAPVTDTEIGAQSADDADAVNLDVSGSFSDADNDTLTYSATGLPGGLSMSSAGVISGTIDADASQGGTSGVYSVTVTASDSEGGTTTSTFDYTVSNVAPVTDTEIGAQSADDADAVNLDVSGSFSDADNDTLTYSATGLPGGLSMSSAGVISGTIDADASQGGTSGVYSVTVTASDSEGGTTTSTFDYTVSNVAPVTDTEIGAQSADDADAVNLDVSGSFSDADNDTLTYSATGLPGGLSMSSAGVISGTIDADASQGGTSGVYSVTVTASDSEGGTTTSTFDYTVSNVAPVTDTEIGAQSADDADAVNLDVSGSFSDADNDTLTYSATGLPGGLSMSSAGVISGTIDADASQGGTSGVYSVTVTASDSEGGTTTSTFDYTVSNVAPVTDTEIGAQSADDADAVNLDVSGSFSDADNDTLTYSATGLPGGLSMSSAGVISGTIDADASQGGTSGVYSVTVTASDSEGGTTTSTFDYTVSNVAPVTDTEIGAQSADDADAVNLDVSGSFSDADNDTLTYSATGLPGGLSMSSAGVISGTIDADASQGGTSGVYSVTVTASDSEGGTTTSTFDYTVSNVAPVTDTEIGAQSADDADAVNLDVSGSFSDADNDTLTYSATGLPGGLSMSSAGVISGTIDADASQGGTSGVYSVTVTASDSEGGTTTSTFDYTVSNVAPVTDTEIGAQSADDADAVNLDVSGSFSDADNDTLTYSATGLPGGLSMSSAGVISGTIDADASQGGTSGVYSVTVTASDSEGGTTTSTFDYTVSNVAPVTDTEIGAQSADDADAVNLDVSGSFSDADNDTLTYSATGLPGGLSMSSAGVISGTIDADASQGGTSGVYSVTVTASDSEGGTTTSTFDYTVSNVAPVTDTEIGAQSADDADAVNLDVSGSFSDADNDTLTYSATGLPGGLSMSSAGVISGTIDADASQGGTSGVYSVTVTASDSEGGTTTSTFDYTVSNVAPVTDTEIGAQSADDADAVNLDVSGSFSDADNDTLTYSATGLPGGLSMSSAGVISGTIDADASQGGTSGVYSVTVTASDSEGGTTTSTFDYTVSNVAPVTDTEIGAQSADDADAVNLDVSGSFSDADNDTLTYSATGLPGGLSMSSAGVISGTIDADASQGGTSGVYSVTVTASDSEGGTTTSTFDYTVSNVAPVTDTEIGAQSADDADAVNLDVSGSFSDADNDTLTYSATGLPGGLSMSSAGVISGTIDADASQGGTSGVYSVTVTASDSEGGTTTSTFDYTVSNVAPVTDTEIGAQSADDADAVNLDVSGSFSDADNDTLTYSATGLPGGLSMSSAGVISGTIDADASQGGTSGVYSVTVTASDSEGGTTTSTFDYTVSNVAPVTDTEIGAQSADDADAVNLDVSGSFSDADNDTLTYSATGLPGGLSMSSAGVISGTIDADASQGGTSGVYSVTVTASDSEGGTTTSTFDYTVSNVAPVTDTEIGAQSADDADAVNLDVSGSFSDADNDTLTYSATGLPGGLSMSSAGVISGTIDADASQGGTSGVYSVTVTASDSEGGTTTSTFDYTVSNVAPVTDTEIGAQSADDADAVNLDVSGSFSDADNDTLTYSATGLPGGLSMSSAGVISGTIDADASQGGTSGVYSVTVTASDSEGGTTTSTFDYTVSNVAPVTDTEIGAQSADDADAVNLDVSGSFSDADNDTLTYSATGLPGGLSMSSAGVISGTIDADASQGGTSGVYSVTVTASDSEGGTTTSTFDYTVSNVAPVTDTEIGAQSADDADAVNLDVSGSFSDADNDTLTYSATGLPGGLSMSSAGVISGTIDADASQGGTSGVYSVTVTASDSEGGTTTSTFDYTVSNVAPVTDTEIGAQSADDADAVNLDVSGSFSDADNDTLTYSATGLPGGLSMSSAGVISGTIDADASQGGTSGVYSVTVTASDSEGGTTTSTFDYTVSNVAPVTDTEIGAQSADDADAVNLDVSGSFSDADNDTLTYSATGLPGGLSMSSAGVISGTIDADASQGGTSGVYSVTVTASDSEGGTTTSTFDYTVTSTLTTTQPSHQLLQCWCRLVRQLPVIA